MNVVRVKDGSATGTETVGFLGGKTQGILWIFFLAQIVDIYVFFSNGTTEPLEDIGIPLFWDGIYNHLAGESCGRDGLESKVDTGNL